MKTRQIELSEISEKIDPIVSMRNDNWFLVTAKNAKGQVNGLTAAWGAFGNLCEKPAVTVYIRPQRYTKKFIDDAGIFTMTFFDFQQYKDALIYMGSKSGAEDPEKIKNAGLHITDVEGQPSYQEGKYVMICRPFFQQQLSLNGFLDKDIEKQCFPDHDNSVMYISEILGAYEILK